MTEERITTAEEYRKRFGTRFKVVKLPSGETFKIRKLEVIDFLNRTMVPLGFVTVEDMKSWTEKSKAERAEIITKNTTPERNEELSNWMLASGVSEPRIVLSDLTGPNEISVHDIDPLDRAMLVEEITKFSGLAGEGREEITPFPA